MATFSAIYDPRIACLIFLHGLIKAGYNKVCSARADGQTPANQRFSVGTLGKSHIAWAPD